MKIEKYNQRILAVLGTVGVIFLIVALIAFISITIMEHQRFDEDVETGILSDEKIEELQKENKREQVISYENPRLIDTLNSVYIIPVSHKTLNEPEDIGKTLNAFSSSDSYEKSDSRYSSYHYGVFNNLIVYDAKKGLNKNLFDKRVNFNQIKAEYFDNDILVLMKVSEKDTYKDGVINLLDFKKLYIYSFEKKELKDIGIEGMEVVSYKFINDEKDLTILFGIDKNEDGKYEDYNEPTMIKRYDFSSGKLTDVVDEKINSELQKTLEGTKK
ncbi:hypothetical protein [uncultured Maribacter sp.]|uniref:hypothetical protein n=1 Tax=uncultured Maribacter sp. TaxID=431308 RepID=UPI002607D0E4|nr:hypothetical protein [uncultured Maribacter sp.]